MSKQEEKQQLSGGAMTAVFQENTLIGQLAPAKREVTEVMLGVLRILEGLTTLEVVRVLNAAAAFYNVTDEVEL